MTIPKGKNTIETCIYMNVKSITDLIEAEAPLALQESYDNAGLLVGSKDMEVTAVLISIDVTEDVIDEAIRKNCNLIVSHHPLISPDSNDLQDKMKYNAV